MISFKEYLTENEFDILESLAPVKWKEDDNEHIHRANVDGKRVTVHVAKHYHKNVNGSQVTQHSVRFEVSGDMSKKKKMDANLGRKVLLHVAHAVHSYTQTNTKKGDIITMSAYDSDPDMKAAKNHTYQQFAQRLAKSKGGTYNVRNGRLMTVHSIHL